MLAWEILLEFMQLDDLLEHSGGARNLLRSDLIAASAAATRLQVENKTKELLNVLYTDG